MIKTQIVDTISQRTGIDKSAAKFIIEQLMECIKCTLSNGDNVTLRGFGSFVLKKRAVRHFHAPSGKLFVIPEHQESVFKPCKELKSALLPKDAESSMLNL